MKKLLKKIAIVGVDYKLSNLDNKKIVLTNSYSLIFGIVGCIYGFVLLALGITQMGLVSFFVAACFWLSLYMNHMSWHNVARYSIVFILSFVIYVYSTSLGRNSEVHYWFSTAMVFPFIIFELKERKALFFSAIFPLVMLFFTLLSNFQYKFLSVVLLDSSQVVSVSFFMILFSNTITLLLVFGLVLAHNEAEEKVMASKDNLEKSKILLESALATKTRFLANMSHEIRTPMNGVIGMTNLLLGSTNNPEQIEKLKIIQNCGTHLLDLINDILDFSKLEVDKLELVNEPYAVNECVQEIIQLLGTRASEKGLLLFYNAPSDMPSMICGDIVRFRQILTNLLSNAIKFTEKGSVIVSAFAKQLENDLYEFQFSVKDTGIGIPEDAKNKLFQSFSQVDASITKKFGGTGLGLAISKGLCEKMGGTIHVTSQVGKGSTFIFTFKALKIAEVKIINNPPLVAVDCEMGKKNPLNILVVEDNKANQIVLLGILGSLGYHADVVGNGLEALKNISNKSYNIILMDCHMPIMDGFEAAKKIVEQFSKEEKPRIIAVTASTMKEDADRCFESGMDAIIAKPVNISILAKILDECYAHGQSESAKVA